MMQVLKAALLACEGRQSSVQVIPLAGDASTRRYYRVVGERNFILQVAEPFDGKNEFLKVHSFLEQTGIPVPKVLAVDAASGTVLQEDLGELTLFQALHDRGKSWEKTAFEGALRLLAQLHQQAEPARYKGEAPAGFQQAFDVEKLMWEVRFTLDHFYSGTLKRPLEGAALEKVLGDWEKICTALSDEPRVFTHRDYHTRNIMVAEADRLVMIDFQDARMGLRQYDLVSLLRDSYYPLTESAVEHGIDFYWNECVRLGAPAPGAAAMKEFHRVFGLMTLQRSFKAIGSFGFQTSVRKNNFYLPYIEPAFQNLQRVWAQHPEYGEMAALLVGAYRG